MNRTEFRFHSSFHANTFERQGRDIELTTSVLGKPVSEKKFWDQKMTF